MEDDALRLAALRLQNANPDAPLTSEDLLREANNILPEPGRPEAIRLFFATNNQIQDDAIDSVCDFASLIYTSASAQPPQESPLRMDVLADLAHAYSYVIEAAMHLQSHGQVSARRKTEIEALITRPESLDENSAEEKTNRALFDLASQLFEARKHPEGL